MQKVRISLLEKCNMLNTQRFTLTVGLCNKQSYNGFTTNLHKNNIPSAKETQKKCPDHIGHGTLQRNTDIEIISGCKSTDIISEYQSKREEIVAQPDADIRLHTVMGSDAVADIQPHAPSFGLLPYRVGDGYNLMPGKDADAVQRWVVSTDPCRIGAVCISFLRDGYLHFNAICATYLHSISFYWQSPRLISHHNAIHGDGLQV